VSPRRADIQGLRGIAVLLVVSFHTDVAFSGGFIGVDVFFVISGFVITALLLRELEADGHISLSTFYARRVRRLLPALALVLVVVALTSVALLNPLYGNSRTGIPEGLELRPQSTQSHAALTGAATSLLGANAELYKATNGYFEPAATTNPLLHMWSLSVEEQFYLVFPSLLLGSWRLSRRLRGWTPRATAGATLALLAAASFGLCAVITGRNHRLAFYSSPTRAWEFAAGGLVALLATTIVRLPGKWRHLLGGVGAALILLAACGISSTQRFPGQVALLPVAGSALVLAAGTGASVGVSVLLRLRPLVWIGDVSYGWYLWHWPLIVFTQVLWPGEKALLPIAAVASLLPTWLSYRLVEQPVRSSTRLRGRRLVAFATVLVLVPVASAGGLLLSAKKTRESAAVRRVGTQIAVHADVLRGCNSMQPLGERTVPGCTTTVPASRGTIVLVGDSNAGQFTEPVEAAAKALRLDFTVATLSSCPFVDLFVTWSTKAFDSDACRRFVSETTLSLVKLRPALVVIASDSTGYIGSPEIRLSNGDANGTTSSPTGKSALWNRGLLSVLQALHDADIPTLVVHTIPQFQSFSLFLCPAIRLILDPESCGTTATRQQIDDQRRKALEAERSAIEQVPGAAGLDLAGDLCNASTCTTNHGETWIYRDGEHLSVGGAVGLTDHFTSAIGETARSSLAS